MFYDVETTGVDESRLHDANYDIELTRGVYRIVTGIDYEL
jgi:hypothetical protein